MTPDLSALKGIHLPPPVSPWPLAPGWILVIILVSISLLLLFILGKVGIRKIKRRQNALAQLKQIEFAYSNQAIKGSQACYQLSKLLKQVLMLKENREDIASLSGPAWINALKDEPFAKIIYENEYKKECSVDLKPTFTHVKRFIHNLL